MDLVAMVASKRQAFRLHSVLLCKRFRGRPVVPLLIKLTFWERRIAMKRTPLYATLVALGTCMWLVLPATAQQKKAERPFTDQQFVERASAAGLAEVDLAKLALKHATSEDVKSFARHMIDDHSKANKELDRIADTKNLARATTMNKKHRALAEKLSGLTGADFDREYMKHMVSDHKEAVALFERAARDGQDPAIKEFASKTLPTLREHLKMARKIAGVDEKQEGATKDRPDSHSK